MNKDDDVLGRPYRRLQDFNVEQVISIYSTNNINKPHVQRVVGYAVIIAEELGLRQEAIDLLARVAAGHDLVEDFDISSNNRDVILANSALIRKYGFS